MGQRCCKSSAVDESAADAYGVGDIELPPETATAISKKYHSEGIMSVVAVSDTKYVTGGEEGSINLMDTNKIEPIQKIDGAHKADVRRLTFHSSQNLLVSCGRDKVAKLWSMSGNDISCTGTLEGHTMPVANAAISPSGSRIMTGSRDNTVRLWDTSTSKQFHVNNTARNLVHCLSWLDENTVAQGGENLKIYLWDTRDDAIKQAGEPLTGIKEQPVCMFPVFEKEYEIYVGYKGFTEASALIRRFDIRKREIVQTLIGHDKTICDISHDGTTLTSASQDCTLRTWDDIGTLQNTLMLNPAGAPTDLATLKSHAVVSTTEELIVLSKGHGNAYTVARRYT